MPTFSLGVVLWWPLANPSCVLNLKLLTSAVAQILKGNPKRLGASLAQGYAHFFSGCGFMMGLDKPKVHGKFEVDIFSRCTNIKRVPQYFGELL